MPSPSDRASAGRLDTAGKKTAVEIHRAIDHEIDSLLQRIFAERHRTGGWDLEAIEMAFRAAMHHAGASGLTQLLTEEPPAQRHLPCACGGTADYEEVRSKPVLTAVGPPPTPPDQSTVSPCPVGNVPSHPASL